MADSNTLPTVEITQENVTYDCTKSDHYDNAVPSYDIVGAMSEAEHTLLDVSIPTFCLRNTSSGNLRKRIARQQALLQKPMSFRPYKPIRKSSTRISLIDITSKQGAKITIRIDSSQHVAADDCASVFTKTSVESDEINIRLSASSLKHLKTKRSLKEKIYRMFGCYEEMTQTEFDDVADKLYKCTLKSIRDAHELHIRRCMGIQMIEDIIQRCPSDFLTFPHVIHITWAIMSCMHHYQLRLRMDALRIIFRVRKKKYDSCLKAFAHFLRKLKMDVRRVTINAILVFYKEGKLWDIEFACSEMIMIVIESYQKPEECIEDVVHTIEDSTCYNMYEAKRVTQVLYEILKFVRWRHMSRDLMRILLHLYMSSVTPFAEDKYDCIPLKNGLELCIMNLISNLSKKDLMQMFEVLTHKLATLDTKQEKLILNLGNLALYTVKKFRLKSKHPFSSKGLLPDLVHLQQTELPIMIYLSVQIWKQLFDTYDIADKSLSPRIYYPGTDYDIPKVKCRKDDKMYVRAHRRFFYRATLAGVTSISNSRNLLIEHHKAIVLTQVQLPCGYGASIYVALAMAFQEYAFKIKKKNLLRSYHMHAFVMSMLTCFCKLYEAKVLWEHVSKIMELRAQWAPHLNPPLQPSYQYAMHHVLWNKPELFFDDWEVRFGLWKCFRIKKELSSKTL